MLCFTCLCIYSCPVSIIIFECIQLSLLFFSANSNDNKNKHMAQYGGHNPNIQS